FVKFDLKLINFYKINKKYATFLHNHPVLGKKSAKTGEKVAEGVGSDPAGQLVTGIYTKNFRAHSSVSSGVEGSVHRTERSRWNQVSWRLAYCRVLVFMAATAASSEHFPSR